MKALKKILIIVLILIAVAVGIIFPSIGKIVTKTVNTVGPKATQSDVTLENFKLNPFTGAGHVSGLVLGNPEGFKTKSAFKVDDIKIQLDPKSLLTDTIHIHSIIIKAPHVTLEKGLTSSNFEQIQKNIAAFTGTDQAAAGEEDAEGKARKEAEEAAAEPAGKKEAKKVIIDLIRVEDGRVNLSFKGLQGLAAPIPLPLIELKDIGKKEDDPKNFIEIVNLVIGKVLGAATGVTADAIKGVGGLGADAVKGVGSILKDAAGSLTGEGDEEVDQDELEEKVEKAAKEIEEEAGKAVESLKKLFN